MIRFVLILRAPLVRHRCIPKRWICWGQKRVVAWLLRDFEVVWPFRSFPSPRDFAWSGALLSSPLGCPRRTRLTESRTDLPQSEDDQLSWSCQEWEGNLKIKKKSSTIAFKNGFLPHTGAKIHFLSINSLDFGVWNNAIFFWNMRFFLLKMRF